MSDDFKCLECEKTLEQLKKTPDEIPRTHTNFGLKGDKHELCHRCWTNIRRRKRKVAKSKDNFRCLCCKRTNEELQELAKKKKYYGMRRRLPGESKKQAAKYCGSCYAKLRKSMLTLNSPDIPIITAAEKA